MSILGPVLFAAMFIIPIWVSTRESEDLKKVAVIDSTMEFINKIPDNKHLIFVYQPPFTLQDYKYKMKNNKAFDAVLYIPKKAIEDPSSIQLISHKQVNYTVTSYITAALEKDLTEKKMLAFGIENFEKIMESAKTNVQIQTITVSEAGEKESNVNINMGLGYLLGLLIYMFIFMFGAQVMRGVIEEKTNRIVEVIISSVKPFQLMMGKVIGIALVVLTQITFWIIMTVTFVLIMKAVFAPDLKMDQLKSPVASQSIMSPGSIGNSAPNTAIASNQNSANIQKAFEKLNSINFVKIIGWFIFFFIGGYLLYGSFFAAIGSVVDNDADTQQFMLPITIPLILGLFVMFYTLNNHDSNIAYWFSIFPLTSPIVMMARIPFDAPNSEIILSAVILILTFIGAIWMAGKIYRTGILIYGKKIGYKEIFRWIKYKQ
jgi:ABC-2 type transport system permease protein